MKPAPRVTIQALETDERGRPLLVIDPRTRRPLEAMKPTEVVMSDYWARRLNDRSVEVVPAEEAAAPKQPRKAKK